jgi:hypothetical protein
MEKKSNPQSNINKTKMINKIEISDLEINKIKTFCDYLFVDRVKDFSTFQRFEQCFGPLFSDKTDFTLSEAFKEICGKNKKYITFKRMLSSYINWKSNHSKNKHFNYFMSSLFTNKIIKSNEDTIGELNENCQIFSTQNCQGRKAISKFGIFSDYKKTKIQGFLLEYDDSFYANLSFRHESDTPALEINLKPYKVDEVYGKIFDNDRDGVSHISGKYDIKEKKIYFLVLKSRRGKTFYIGDNTKKDENDVMPFIFGNSDLEIKGLRIATFKNQLCYLELNFQKSMRINPNLAIDFEKIDEKFLEEDQLIFEEKKIQNININDTNYDKYILIPLVKDTAFMDESSLTEIRDGKKFNEIYHSKYNFEDKNEIKIFGDEIVQEITKMIKEEDKNDDNKDKKVISNGEFLSNIDNLDELLGDMEKDIKNKK